MWEAPCGQGLFAVSTGRCITGVVNRILFEPVERVGNRVSLRGPRADHIRRVLRAAPGDTVKLGEINGPRATGRVVELSGGTVTLDVEDGEMPARPRVDLLLALPRPKVLRRLLPQISALGVGRLFLCNAARVERAYFDTHVLASGPLRAALLEGLTQAGDTLLPDVRIVRRLKVFLEDALDASTDAGRRVWLHPGAGPLLHSLGSGAGRALLAVGPEGGWVPYERELFLSRGFLPASLSPRVLRSDTATILALGVLAGNASATDANPREQ